MSKRMKIMATLLTVVAVGQIISAIFLYNPSANSTIINIGWGVLWLSAIFGWLPIFTFRRKGKVQGRSYTQTTVLVDSGIYAIVRHPQYLAGILIAIALPLISQHWLVAVLGVIGIPIYYQNTYDEEENCIKKFGDEYKRYMERVPRVNFIAGIIRVLRRPTK